VNGRLLSCGELSVLVEVESLDEVLALHAAVRTLVEAEDGEFAGIVDVVPAARTVLLTVGDGADVAPLRRALPALLATDLAAASAPGSDQPSAQPVEILVQYDGADLDDVAHLTGLTPAEVVARHTGQLWRAAFGGFAPGFAYLTGGDTRLHVPRRREPRTSVPAGSVALAGEFSAVYPRASPGGWQLLGHTDAVLFAVDREPPALLQPGGLVRFVDADRPAR